MFSAQKHRVDLINLSTLGEHDVDADGPLIMLSGCKHVYTVIGELLAIQ